MDLSSEDFISSATVWEKQTQPYIWLSYKSPSEKIPFP